jgi:hypothetical protein
MRLKKRIILLIIPALFGLAVNLNIAKAEDAPITEPDITAPIINLIGEASITLNTGDIYVDAGATASDNIDGDITANIITTNLVDTAIAGNYTVTYTVSDMAGNTAAPVTRNIIVNSLPVVTNENFIIRNGENIIWQGPVPLPNSGTVSINDSNGTTHSINAQSVLALLYSIDQSSEAFSISNLQYYDSFGSFYVKCILPANGTELCDNWQYAIGLTTPWQSIDANILSDEQTVGVFFGSPHRLSFDSNTIDANTNFLLKAQNYNYTNNAWDPLLGVSIGVTLPNPNDPWNPAIVSTHLVDGSGAVNISLSEPNTYNIGIVEDFYFPSYPITISTPLAPTPTSSGGGSSLINNKKYFNVPLALNYLKNAQAVDGSFGDGKMYTDWVAIAYGAANVTGDSRDLLISYLKNNPQASSLLTDNERRTMALLALGENPYNFEGTNYIDTIIKEFDGQQFGDSSLVNDDIFALIPLLNSGYTKDDEIINKTVSYILSKQNTDGSWNQSVDISAAAIQVLSTLSSMDGVLSALDKAEQYIKNKQSSDGGFGSIYSTSWAAQAMTTLNKNWINNENTPLDYLATQQALDGAAISSSEPMTSRIWATSYAIPAALGKTWNSILKTVTKPIAAEPILDEVKILDNMVLGIKEVAPENINKPAVAINYNLKKSNTSQEEKNNLSETTSTNNEPAKINDNLTEKKPEANNKFLALILVIFIFGTGGLVIYFRKK